MPLPNVDMRGRMHTLFKRITKNVYYQPPSSIRLEYPCIVYQPVSVETQSANDIGYLNTTSYQITVIDRDPESLIPYEILNSFSKGRLEQMYTTDNLHHTTININM